jgi:RNA polymerase sigma factor (sigma-70 family)
VKTSTQKLRTLRTPVDLDSIPVTLFGKRQEHALVGSETVSDDDATFWVSLARRIERGDREAEAELARQLYVRVRPMASVHLRWSDAAVDIAQETIVQALEALRAGRLREPEKLPAFVLGIARNLINNYKRKEARSREVLQHPPDRLVEADPTLARLDEQQRALVRAALARLSPVDRRILLLTLVNDRTPREIAPTIGLTPEVVRTRKSRAIKALADEIEVMTRTSSSDHVL